MNETEVYDRFPVARSATRSRSISPDDIVRFPSDADDITRERIDRVAKLQLVDKLALRPVVDCKAETENLLRIETNQNKAVRAHFVATRGEGLFGNIRWIGAFIDEHGVFYAFIERNRDWKLSHSFGSVEGLVLDKINAEALAVFKNLTTSAVFDGKTYDRFTQPYELDKLKILHDNARRFQRNYGLINLKELVLGELRHSRDELYLLDYRKHLLSPGEFLTADILASKDFVLRDLNMEEASLNAPRRQLHSMGGVIDFPMTERGAATFARALELGLGAVDEVENDDFFQYRGTVSSPELQVTGDRQAAAKAFLIARFGTTEFLQLSWLGEFSDDEGTYHAYLKAGHSPDVLRGTLQGQFFSNPEQMMEDWETLKKDMRATPATIRYHRQYAELRRKIDHFTLTTGLEAKAAGADLNLGFVRESVTQDLRLDGERVLPHLSARQSENILIAAKFFKPKSTAS